MELRQLKYFLAVAEHQQVTKAAMALGMAQPPLSQQILKLERELGVTLFRRHPRHIELTAAGVEFQQRARQILYDIQQARIATQKIGQGKLGALMIGFAGSTVFHANVAHLLHRFREHFPAVQLDSVESNSPQLVEQVLNKRLSAAVIRLPLSCPELTGTVIAKETWVAALPAKHRLSGMSDITLSALANEPFVLFPRVIGPGLYDALLESCYQAGFSPNISLLSPQISSTINMVSTGFGVTLVPQSMMQIQAPGVTFHSLDIPWSSSITLVYRDDDDNPILANLLSVLNSGS